MNLAKGGDDESAAGDERAATPVGRRRVPAVLVGSGLGAAACVPVAVSGLAGSGLLGADDEQPPPPRPRGPRPAAEFYAGPAAAAAATKVTVPTIVDTSNPVSHLLCRVTFGPTPQLPAEVSSTGIDRWLATQLDPEADLVWQAFPTAAMSARQVRGAVKEYSWDAMVAYAQATLARQLSVAQ
ncbi:hypothetical protein SAMN04487818_101448 [Actinokineospora terrae]|uniref:Uncharacterized protein n=1 Tax=Actinokineospora terrae TaxID=155974 RepID=A0A1H9L4C2_9PSEU|nr:hypothetical protein SAMN04487818_101448 [Actinokineospora terrae]